MNHWTQNVLKINDNLKKTALDFKKTKFQKPKMFRKIKLNLRKTKHNERTEKLGTNWMMMFVHNFS